MATPQATAADRGGNRLCGEGKTALKLDRAPVLGETITDGRLRITITRVKSKVDDSREVYGFDYRANIGSVTTIVKGGPTAVTYARRVNLDTKLSPGGRHYGISNVTWCYVRT
jgi:hypothetical protein